LKILFLNPNIVTNRNVGHHLFKMEIAKQHDVTFYGRGHQYFDENLSAKEILNKHCDRKPDIIFTYFWKYWQDLKGLGEIDNIPKVHFTLDYTRLHKHYESYRKAFYEDKHDLLFAPTMRCCNLLRNDTKTKNVYQLPFSADTNYFINYNIKKQNMVLASFTDRTDFYPNRKKLKQIIESCGIRQINNAAYLRYVNSINKCKVSVTSNDVFGTVSMKYSEILACGGFLLADRPVELEHLGYKDKKHLVIYDDFGDFRDKLKYYMNDKNSAERKAIERNGMKFVRRYHSCKVRVKQMTKIINDVLGVK
jgi:spore maturation protein CgeB